MPQNEPTPGEQPILSADNALRTLVLASFYAGAVFFAVVFSPSMGYSPTHPAPLVAAGQSAALR